MITDLNETNANTFYQIGVIPTAPITGVNLTNQTLTVRGTGIASNTQLGNAVGGLSDAVSDAVKKP